MYRQLRDTRYVDKTILITLIKIIHSYARGKVVYLWVRLKFY